MTSALLQSDFEELIKVDKVQLSILKDYVKDKEKKITVLKVANAILALLLSFLLSFTVITCKKTSQSQTTETVIQELNLVNKTELRAETSHQVDRSKNVGRNKKDK